MKVEAIVVRDRVETVMEAVEEQTPAPEAEATPPPVVETPSVEETPEAPTQEGDA